MSMDRHARTLLRRELQHAEAERDRLTVVIAYLRERLEEGEQTPVPPQQQQRPQQRPQRAAPKRRTSTSGRITSAAAAEKVLAERGEPMRTRELLDAVQAAGARMKDPDGLFKTLSRSAAFRKVGRGLWALAEWPDSSPNGSGQLNDGEFHFTNTGDMG
jgi:hypothetical protein